MPCNLGIVYSDDLLRYDFGPGHPLKAVRLKLTFELMKSLGVVGSRNVDVHEPPVAEDDEILLFHEREYVDLVKGMSEMGYGMLDLGDTPAFKGAHEASARVVGASLKAVDLVMAGEAHHATNIAGGLHHAHPDRASGFCIFNDPAVSVAYLKEKYGLKRIAYIDIDAHHGDGVMYGFYSDSSLLDIDFHEDGRYLFPGTGFTYETGDGEGRGIKVNVPLPPGTTDTPYMAAFKEIVPTLIRRYRPEFMLIQCGADAHTGDPLTHLDLTTRTYAGVISLIHGLAHEICQGRLVAFGGGGYRPASVARCWTVIARELAGVAVEDTLSESWRRLYEALVGGVAPRKLGSEDEAPPRRRRNVEESIASTIKELKRATPLLQ